MSASMVLLLIAIVLWLLAAINVPSGRISLGWLGMVFFGIFLLSGRL